MAATPIPPHVVYTVFQYILPPALPIPLHLLSRPLVERHHFLSVSPTDSAAYLCWPSPHTAQVTEALEHAAQGALASEPEHDVRYSAPDQETLLAHVRPYAESPLQIVFTWDAGTESWRYHDARMLPFPDAARSSLDDALANRARAVPGLVFPYSDADEPSNGTRSSSPADDDYWAGYESSGSSLTTPAAPVNDSADEDEKAEAAYWASYSAVHGSGDSTVPSPAPDKTRFPPNQKQPVPRGVDASDPLIAHLHLRLENGLLSPRFDHPQSEYAPSPQSAAKFDVHLHADSGMSSTAIDGHECEDAGYGFPRVSELKMVGPDSSGMTCEKDLCAMEAAAEKRSDAGKADGAVGEAVRGIYRMWKAQTLSGDTGSGAFLNIVQSALEGL